MTRAHAVALFLLTFSLAEAAEAQVLLRRAPATELDEALPERSHPRPTARALAPKAHGASDLLIVPRYLVDSETGDTTLFAVRNSAPHQVPIRIEYYGRLLTDGAQRVDTRTLDAKETLTINIRDVSGLVPQGDGTLQGLVRIFQIGSPPGALSGDYFQVDLLNDFATGDRMLAPEDLCDRFEARYLAGGGFDGGTLLTLVANIPQGFGAEAAPTIVIEVFDEAGNSVDGPWHVFTEQSSLTLPIAELTSSSFGAVEIDFSTSSGGAAFAQYSASGKFSIGLNASCLDAE